MPSPAAYPLNEPSRLERLHRLEILDTLPEQAYDDLTVLASEVCGTPISMVALIDTDRQWYKSAIGTDLRQTERNVAFCAHAILEPHEFFVVEDAAADPRFADNPFVLGELNVRFYAGAPIVLDGGTAVGTLCVVDTRPRQLTDQQRQCLGALARQAAALLDLREKAMTSERLAREHEKMSVEAQLKQKRGIELLDLVLRGGQMGLWDLHVPSGVWTVNAREHLMLGYGGVAAPPDRLDWRSLIPPDDLKTLDEAMRPHVEGRSSFYECTHRMRHADGHDIWVLDRGVIVERNVRGEALRIVGTHVDVTERKLADEEQQRNAERLELAMSGGEHGLWDWNLLTGKVTRNERWRRMFGYSAAEVKKADETGDLRERITHPDDAERYRTALARHLSGLSSMFEVEMRMRHKDGRWIWVLDRGKVVERDDAGRPTRIVGTKMNITARKNAELALRQTGELLAQTGRLAKIGGWEIDVAGRTVTWTEEIYRIHDLNPAEKPNLAQAVDFFLPESKRRLEVALRQATEDATPWDLELTLRTARGRIVWIRTLCSAEVEDGKVVRLMGTAQDITERKLAEMQRGESERQLRLITESLPAAIARIDTNERYTFVNSTVLRVFGLAEADIVGRTMREMRADDLQKGYDSIAPHVAKALAGERVAFEDYAVVRGRPFFYQTHYVPDIDDQGRIGGFFAMTFDITERKRAEMRRVESEERLRGITDNIPVLISELDTQGRFRFANETYRSWLGIDPASVVGKPVGEAVGEAYYAGRRDYIARACRGEKVTFEQSLTLPAGERCLQTTYVPHYDVAGSQAGVYAVTSDITELKDTQRALDRLARYDPLTGLANRRHFEEKLGDAMARTRRSGRPMAVLYLDIDRFKAINDTHGHTAGDAVLVEFGARLSKVVRETDLVARHAGDEFVVVLEGIDDDEEARGVATKLVAAIHPEFIALDRSIRVTTSVGVAIFHGGGDELPALLSRADGALYDAKARGRDCFSVATA